MKLAVTSLSYNFLYRASRWLRQRLRRDPAQDPVLRRVFVYVDGVDARVADPFEIEEKISKYFVDNHVTSDDIVTACQAIERGRKLGPDPGHAFEHGLALVANLATTVFDLKPLDSTKFTGLTTEERAFVYAQWLAWCADQKKSTAGSPRPSPPPAGPTGSDLTGPPSSASGSTATAPPSPSTSA